jgi:hypothetical protein
MSAAHSLMTAPCCAIAYVVESKATTLIAKKVFSIGALLVVAPHTPNELVLGVAGAQSNGLANCRHPTSI